MIVAGSASPLLLSSAGGYNLTKSLRFRSSASAYLSRTPASAGNKQIWTLSFWLKTSKSNFDYYIAEASTNSSTDRTSISFNGGKLQIRHIDGSATQFTIETTQVFRDPSSWYHFVIAVDTTQATSTNRVKVYVNGSQITAFGTANYPTQNLNTDWNGANAHSIGSSTTPDSYADMYLTEFYNIDGQQLTPSSFGQTSSITGVWQPIKYTGTYGTNGFYLPFTDVATTSGSNAGLGKDFSGNGNYWTTNNISVTSGATYDSMTDVPTLTDADTANYCVLNPLSKGTNTSITNANLSASYGSAAWTSAFGTLGVSTGKWYWEATLTSAGTDAGVGISTNPAGSANSYIGGDANSWGYYANNGNKWNNGSSSSYGATYANGDVIGVALDLDAGTLVFYKNNSSQGTAFSSLASNTYFPALSVNNSSFAVNFGQRPFAYTPPTGFKALNTFNLPTPTIGATASTQAGKYFNPVIWTGTGGTRSITGVGFQPDFVWAKARSQAYSNIVFDSNRGVGKSLLTDTTGAEVTNEANGYISSFDADGFSSNFSAAANYYFNQSGTTYVAWNWKANGSGSTNTSGSITSTVSANTTAGFSIVTFTAPSGSTAYTVGHGLGTTPAMIIVKERGAAGNDWYVWHQSFSNTAQGNLRLNTTAAVGNSSQVWNNTAPTSTVFSSIAGTAVASSTTAVAYCFAQVAGYSAFGSYTGNGSTDGPFVFTGFRPRYVLIKKSSSATDSDWRCFDTARNTYNVVDLALYPNLSVAEGTFSVLDFTSNGFKLRNTGAGTNANSATYIYMAFAESPFKYANAR